MSLPSAATPFFHNTKIKKTNARTPHIRTTPVLHRGKKTSVHHENPPVRYLHSKSCADPPPINSVVMTTIGCVALHRFRCRVEHCVSSRLKTRFIGKSVANHTPNPCLRGRSVIVQNCYGFTYWFLLAACSMAFQDRWKGCRSYQSMRLCAFRKKTSRRLYAIDGKVKKSGKMAKWLHYLMNRRSMDWSHLVADE